MADYISPSLAGGFRDYLPEDMIPRQKILDTVRAVFERFGFVPLETPGLEREEVLTGGDESFSKQIFRARLKEGKEELALRFDLTVPLARVIAAYPQAIEKPVKIYQVGKVWRGERPQAGRFREFVQFDADIVGSARMLADAEIIALIYETLTALRVPNFLIRVNNRKILSGLPEYAGFNSKDVDKALRIIDKMDRLGWDGVSNELTEAIGLDVKQLDAIKRFLDIHAENRQETLREVNALMKTSSTVLEGVNELLEIANHLTALGVPEKAWVIDLSVTRGLGYYTGPVFEAILTDMPAVGSVFSGGRYDGLITRFSPSTIPATGASIGVDRLFAAMKQLGVIEQSKVTARVFVFNFDKETETPCEEITTKLRRANIPTELYIGKETTIKGQLAYAVKKEFPVAIIIGEDEKARGVAKIKDMKARHQMEVPQDEVVNTVKEILSRLTKSVVV